MWNITKQAKDEFLSRNVLPIHESDEDWEMVIREAEEEGEDLFGRLQADLLDVKEELLRVLPIRFDPYVEDGTLNQPTLPKAVREDYLQWIQEGSETFVKVLNAAHEQTEACLAYLSPEVQAVFSESLHDAVIERIERHGNDLQLFINTDGGFTTKARIQLKLAGVIAEVCDIPLEVGQVIVYYELQKVDDKIAFRILFDCPDAEWTILVKKLEAVYYFRPAVLARLRDDSVDEAIPFNDCVSELNVDHSYWLITRDVTVIIQEFVDNGMVIVGGDVKVGAEEWTITVGAKSYFYHVDEYPPQHCIFTDVYEDPYVHLSEPVPHEQLVQAAFSEDLDLQVRAWSTMYANAYELADVIREVLAIVEITEENEMMLSVYVQHFSQEGILTKALLEKFRPLLKD